MVDDDRVCLYLLRDQPQPKFALQRRLQRGIHLDIGGVLCALLTRQGNPREIDSIPSVQAGVINHGPVTGVDTSRARDRKNMYELTHGKNPGDPAISEV